MDIQAEKIELAKLILSTNDTGLLSTIKSLFKNTEDNWLDDLPQYVQEGVARSIEQADRGEFISYDDVQKEVSVLLKK